MDLLFAAAAGALAGATHALAGPDHLAAVAPLTAGQSGDHRWRAGALWGLGHAAGVVLLGLLALGARSWLDPGWISAVGERVVGLALIAVGLWGVAASMARWTASRPHRHGDHVHRHPQLRPPGRRAHSHASLVIGVLHGVAGGSHLLMALPALALPGALASGAFLVGFAAGTVLAMAAFAGMVGRIAAGRLLRPAAGPAFLAACSVASLAVGAVWVLR